MKNKVVISITLSLVVFLLLLSALVFRTGSLQSAFAYLNGYPYTVSPKYHDLGNCDPGTEEEISFLIINFSKNDIVITGEQSGCSCVQLEDLPITLHSKETKEIKIHVKLPKYKHDFHQKITFIVKTNTVTLLSNVEIVAFIPNPLPAPSEDNLIINSNMNYDIYQGR